MAEEKLKNFARKSNQKEEKLIKLKCGKAKEKCHFNSVPNHGHGHAHMQHIIRSLFTYVTSFFATFFSFISSNSLSALLQSLTFSHALIIEL